jgi:hypothetical protein
MEEEAKELPGLFYKALILLIRTPIVPLKLPTMGF